MKRSDSAELTLELLSKSVYADHSESVESPGYQFVFITRFQLKGDQRTFGLDNTGQARNGLAQGRRG